MISLKIELWLVVLAAMFWLRGAAHCWWLWWSTVGEKNGARALIVTLSKLLSIRGCELAYVAVVWTVPIATRASDPLLEHAIRAGYVLLNLASILVTLQVLGAWRRQREVPA